MDPELGRLFGGERDALSLRVSMIVHGVVLTGAPAHPSRWGEDVNKLIEEQPASPDVDALDLAWLAEAPTATDADQHAYGTLRDVMVVLPSGEAFRVSFVRVDLEQVDAWWLRPPEPRTPGSVSAATP
jgi:hypothetical protein